VHFPDSLEFLQSTLRTVGKFSQDETAELARDRVARLIAPSIAAKAARKSPRR